MGGIALCEHETAVLLSVDCQIRSAALVGPAEDTGAVRASVTNKHLYVMQWNAHVSGGLGVQQRTHDR